MARPRKFTVSEEKLREMFVEKRMAIGAIARELGVTAGTIIVRLSEFGLQRDGSIRELEIPVEEVKRLYLEGNRSIKEIGRKFGCSANAIRDRIVAGGFLKTETILRKKQVRFSLTEERLRSMYLDQNMSDMAIAREHNVSHLTVANWRKRHGIKREAAINLVDLPTDELTRMYVEEKMKMEDIAKYFECGESTVRARIVQLGLTLDSTEWLARRMERNSKKYKRRYIREGYRHIMLPNHPSSDKNGYVAEHRYNAEQAIGRYLAFGEQVHHINMQSQDNRVVNLAVLPGREIHAKLHKYMERVAAYLCKLTDVRPEPVVFGCEVFWGGRYVRHIDLIPPTINRDAMQVFEVKQESLGHMAFIH